MGAPVVIEVVASQPPSADLAGALVDGCASAIGPAGCILSDVDRTSPARARVVVSFDEGLMRAHVVVTALPPAADFARDVSFRDADPALERFRAAGLVAAGVVLDVERRATELASPATPLPVASATPPPAPADKGPDAPRPPPIPTAVAPIEAVAPPKSAPSARAAVSASGLLAWTNVRPWCGAVLVTDVALGASNAFLTGSALYGQTFSASAAGVSEERFALGTGAGFTAPIVGPVAIRTHGEVELNDVRASVVQPGTGRHDAGGRLLLGLGGDVAFVVSLRGGVDLVGGARLSWLGDSTDIFVQNRQADAIPAWMYAVTLGVGARFY